MRYNFKNKSIYYEAYGKGPAVILLHGFLESSNMWQKLIPKLALQHTVIIIDFPGHGKSEVISEIHTMELLAEAVHELLQTLHIKNATFIGHSMGGYVALAYAEIYDKVEKLILLNSSPAADSEERKENRDRSLKIIDKIPDAYISMAIGNLFSKESLEKHASEIELLKTEAYSFPLKGIKAAIRGMRDRKDRSLFLKNFKTEKHVILGEEDPILPVLETKSLVNECGAFVKVIKGGHMSIIENFKDVEKYLHFIEL